MRPVGLAGFAGVISRPAYPVSMGSVNAIGRRWRAVFALAIANAAGAVVLAAALSAMIGVGALRSERCDCRACLQRCLPSFLRAIHRILGGVFKW